MKKSFLIITMMVLGISLFAAGAAESATTAKPTTLSVLWFNDANESDVFLDTIQDYLAANPNVKVDMQVIAFNEYEQKLKLMISGGNPPDVARITNNHLAALGPSLEPIDSYVSNIEEVKKQYMPASVAFTLGPKGEMLAYPTEATANGMIVNLTAWKKAGIDVKELSKTWTWTEWEAAVKKVIAANDKIKYGLALDFTPHRFSTIMFEFGGSFMNSNQTAIDFVKKENIDAINYVKHLHDSGLVPKSVWLGSENPAELFQAGLVASHIGGSWLINTYNTNVKDFEWCAVSTPKGKINSSVPGGKFIASFKDSKNKKVAMDLMAAFSDKKHNELYCLNTFNLSSRLDSNVQYPSNVGDFAVFQSDLSKTPAFTAVEWKDANVNKISATLREQIVQVLLGNITADAAVRAVQDKADSL